MKNLNRFFIVYGVIVFISFGISMLELFPYSSIFRDIFTGIAMFGALGMMPVGALQVITAVVSFLDKKEKWWRFYFIPFIIWLIYFSVVSIFNISIDESDIAFLPLYVLPVICYITYTILVEKLYKS